MGILANLFKPRQSGADVERRNADRSAPTAPTPAGQLPGEKDGAPSQETTAANRNFLAVKPQQTPSANPPLRSISFAGASKAEEEEPTSSAAEGKAPGVAVTTRKEPVTHPATLTGVQIKLSLGELLTQIPDSAFKKKPAAGDGKEFQIDANELLEGLAQGKPSIKLSRLAALLPDVFSEKAPADDVDIALPLPKIVAQIGTFPGRQDQVREILPPLDPRYAKLAARTTGDKPATKSKSAAAKPAAVVEPAKKETEAEKVAAETTPSPAPAVRSEPGPLEEEPEEPSTASALEEPAAVAEILNEKVSYSLAALLPNVPKGWFAGNFKPVGDTTRVAFAFRLIESQLASGKVEVAFDDFFQGLPEDLKGHFVGADAAGKSEKLLVPLSEVFQNLPGVEPLPPLEKPEEPAIENIVQQPESPQPPESEKETALKEDGEKPAVTETTAPQESKESAAPAPEPEPVKPASEPEVSTPQAKTGPAEVAEEKAAEPEAAKPESSVPAAKTITPEAVKLAETPAQAPNPEVLAAKEPAPELHAAPVPAEEEKPQPPAGLPKAESTPAMDEETQAPASTESEAAAAKKETELPPAAPATPEAAPAPAASESPAAPEPAPVYPEPSPTFAPPRIAAPIVPPKIQLQRFAPPPLFRVETPVTPPIPAPEKITPPVTLAFAGTSSAFNPAAAPSEPATDEKAKEEKEMPAPAKIITDAAGLPGIKAVVLTIDNETQTAGSIPESFNAFEIGKAASILFQSLEGQSTQAAAGITHNITLHHDQFSSTWFKHGNTLLGALHEQRSLDAEIHDKLARAMREITQPR